ncbi:Rieske (2Fe-2S) protein [Streptomyces subrutilus]|uniref:Rieske (2Fe-2S) protein n=1 Tax=Streptomyces subrutilus TaxID=36818 RepID=UPI0033E5723E
MSDPTRTARRTVLTAGAAALAGGALTACGGGEDGTPANASASAPAPSASRPAASQEPAGADKAIAKATEVPVGGGKILKDEKLVITQPTAGNFRCFSAVCTHQGCLVNKVEDNTIVCPCHMSTFEATDGAPTKGPATRPLAEKKIKVAADGGISLA